MLVDKSLNKVSSCFDIPDKSILFIGGILFCDGCALLESDLLEFVII